MTRAEALKEAERTGKIVMFHDPDRHDEHGMVHPCGCVAIAVGFSREVRMEFCQRCLQKRRQPA